VKSAPSNRVRSAHSGDEVAPTPKVRFRRPRAFLLTWTLALAATASAFVVHLALRGRIVESSQELAKARAEQTRLREVERVLSLEAASYKTPERVETVARTLLGMQPPTDDRIVMMNGTRTPSAVPSAVPSASAHVPVAANGAVP
jgi:cell division protein FtsL